MGIISLGLLALVIGGCSTLLNGCAGPEEQADGDGKDPKAPEENDVVNSIIEAENSMPSEKEKPVDKAVVTCTAAENEEDVVYMLNEKDVVVLNDSALLSRSTIKMSDAFQYCSGTADHKCPLVREIEDNEWKDRDEMNSVKEGEEQLDLEKSYMSCLSGYGIIYFMKSGQDMRDFVGTLTILNKYINDEMFKLLGWDVEAFKGVYGNDVMEKLKESFLMVGIKDEVSICMFLATIGEESGDGKNIIEDYDENAKYTEAVCGVGLMQVTGMNQEHFMNWMIERESDPGLKVLLDLYRKGYDGQTGRADNIVKDNEITASVFLSKHYAVETAVWYWGYAEWPYYKDLSNTEQMNIMTPNEYVSYFASKNECLDNVFLSSQISVNGAEWTYERRQKIALQTDPEYYDVTDDAKKTILSFTVKEGDEMETKDMIGYHSDNGPNNYSKRLEDWRIIYKEMQK